MRLMFQARLMRLSVGGIGEINISGEIVEINISGEISRINVSGEIGRRRHW